MCPYVEATSRALTDGGNVMRILVFIMLMLWELLVTAGVSVALAQDPQQQGNQGWGQGSWECQSRGGENQSTPPQPAPDQSSASQPPPQPAPSPQQPPGSQQGWGSGSSQGWGQWSTPSPWSTDKGTSKSW